MSSIERGLSRHEQLLFPPDSFAVINGDYGNILLKGSMQYLGESGRLEATGEHPGEYLPETEDLTAMSVAFDHDTVLVDQAGRFFDDPRFLRLSVCAWPVIAGDGHLMVQHGVTGICLASPFEPYDITGQRVEPFAITTNWQILSDDLSLPMVANHLFFTQEAMAFRYSIVALLEPPLATALLSR